MKSWVRWIKIVGGMIYIYIYMIRDEQWVCWYVCIYTWKSISIDECGHVKHGKNRLHTYGWVSKASGYAYICMYDGISHSSSWLCIYKYTYIIEPEQWQWQHILIYPYMSKKTNINHIHIWNTFKWPEIMAVTILTRICGNNATNNRQ